MTNGVRGTRIQSSATTTGKSTQIIRNQSQPPPVPVMSMMKQMSRWESGTISAGKIDFSSDRVVPLRDGARS